MANTTNFGWETPDDTDLVKDGAAAMRTLGNAIDTSLVDLKGGTTGQILSKASNTDLDYSWITPNPGDITGVTAGTGISGGGTSGDVTITNSMATAIDAKGDLIAGTGADTFSRLAVGSNNQVLTADSTAATGLKWATPAAGGFFKNPVINSNFSVWQRGTSFSLAASTSYTSGFTADRWQTQTGANQACTISRQTTGDTTNLPNIQYCARHQRNSGQTGTGSLYFGQNFESINSIPFAGKTVTFSFYARAGANFSSASSKLYNYVYTGTGTDQNFFNGYTGSTTALNANYTLTTTWQRFSASFSVGATTTQIGFAFAYDPVGTAGAADYFEVTGVQIEIGSSATDYYPNGNTQQAELAACQRYWQQSYNAGTAGGTASVGGFQMSPIGNSIANGENTGAVTFPTTMRTAPSVSIWSYAGTSGRVSTGNAGGDLGANSGTVQNPSVRHFALYNNSGGTITTNSLQTVFHWTASAEI